jgi:hypothetical protein
MARRPDRAVDWEGYFRQWRSSGLTQAEFCRRHELSLHSFRRRLYRPDSKPAAGGAGRSVDFGRTASHRAAERPPDFLPVRVVGLDRHPQDSATPISPGRPIEVLLGCGRRLTVPPGFDAETLLRIIPLLETARC